MLFDRTIPLLVFSSPPITETIFLISFLYPSFKSSKAVQDKKALFTSRVLFYTVLDYCDICSVTNCIITDVERTAVGMYSSHFINICNNETTTVKISTTNGDLMKLLTAVVVAIFLGIPYIQRTYLGRAKKWYSNRKLKKGGEQ